MLNTGILNPQLLSLLARVRHTNALVIADRGFPFWPTIETVDLSLVDDIPTVLQVLAAIRPNFRIAQAYLAREFLRENTPATRALFAKALQGIP
jgi:D-ribose pyranase